MSNTPTTDEVLISAWERAVQADQSRSWADVDLAAAHHADPNIRQAAWAPNMHAVWTTHTDQAQRLWPHIVLEPPQNTAEVLRAGLSPARTWLLEAYAHAQLDLPIPVVVGLINEIVAWRNPHDHVHEHLLSPGFTSTIVHASARAIDSAKTKLKRKQVLSQVLTRLRHGALCVPEVADAACAQALDKVLGHDVADTPHHGPWPKPNLVPEWLNGWLAWSTANPGASTLKLSPAHARCMVVTGDLTGRWAMDPPERFADWLTRAAAAGPELFSEKNPRLVEAVWSSVLHCADPSTTVDTLYALCARHPSLAPLRPPASQLLHICVELDKTLGPGASARVWSTHAPSLPPHEVVAAVHNAWSELDPRHTSPGSSSAPHVLCHALQCVTHDPLLSDIWRAEPPRRCISFATVHQIRRAHFLALDKRHEEHVHNTRAHTWTDHWNESLAHPNRSAHVSMAWAALAIPPDLHPQVPMSAQLPDVDERGMEPDLQERLAQHALGLTLRAQLVDPDRSDRPKARM